MTRSRVIMLAAMFATLGVAACSSGDDDDSLTPPLQLAVTVIGPEGATYVGESPIDGVGYWTQYMIEDPGVWQDDYQVQLDGTGWEVDPESVTDSGFDASNGSGFVTVRVEPVDSTDIVNVCAWSAEPDPGACESFPDTLSPIPTS